MPSFYFLDTLAIKSLKLVSQKKWSQIVCEIAWKLKCQALHKFCFSRPCWSRVLCLATGLVVHAPGAGHPPRLYLPLYQGGPGVRKSRHLQAG